MASELKMGFKPPAYRMPKERGKCVQIKDWFEGKNYKHLTFVTEDYVVFHVNGSQKDVKAQPSMLDYSMSPKGVTCDLKGKNALKHLKGVQTVLDSYHEDTIYGNDAPNFLSSHGNDFVQGNGGKDIYKIAENCRNTIINNYDQHKERDVIFIEQEFDDLSVSMENTKKSLELLTGGTDKVLAFLHWFKNETYRHATVRTKDGVTALFPSSISEMSAMKNKLKATEISLDREDCNKKLKEYDLSEEHYKGVLRFTAKSDLCSYKVIGNEQNNYIDPGPGNPYGYQYLEGGIGADTYVIGSNYGEFNEINNYATDDKIDFVLLNVKFKHIKVGIKDDTADLILRSTSKYNKVSVVLKGFLYGKEYQHMLLQSADRVLFRLLPHYPHRKAVIVNYAESKHSQILNLTDTFPDAGIFYGAKQHHNVIYGSDSSRKLSAGFKKDTVVGGKLGETIEGLSGDDTINGEAGNDVIYGGDGNDIITGNEGNEVIYGGNGADRINGSDGMDTVLFKGDSIKAKGVTVSLKDGQGRSADAEGDVYTSVEAVIGSEFDDVIEGNDFNNILSGNSGEDTIIAHGGYDILVGGQDSDLYNFTRASGKKIVNNYATDGKTDILWFGKTTQPLCFYSYKNDLFVHFAMDYNENIDLMLKEWYNGSEFQHASLKYININGARKHSHLKHYKDKKDSLTADEWVVLFKERAKVKIINYGNDFVTAKVDYTLKTIPTDMYSIYLNYVSEGEEYRKIDISNMIRPGGTQIKLKPIASGIIASVSLSLHRCSQVLAMTSPVTQRTSPNPPSNFVITHLSDVSITVQWKLPADLNREFYKFRCIAEESGAIDKKVESQIIARTTTSANATSCLIDGLKARTRYYISITSIAGGEISQEVAVIKQTTKHICHRTSVPRNGKITDAQKINGIKMATLACDLGYELSVVDVKGTTLSKIWPTKPLVVCNSTMPCVKWTNGECTEKVKCLEKSCDESVLAAKHLEPKGSGNSEYLHGNTVTLGCINGFRFTNDEDPHGTVDIICWNGNWKNLPKCREIKNCNLLPVKNGYIKIGEQRFGVSGGDNIQLNHELEAQFHCNHGYTLEGTDETRCIDGMLVPNPVKVPPRCRIIDCPSIASPQNGNAALQPSGSPVHGSRYTFSCDSKYFLTGPRTKDCDAGTWKPSGNPRCNPKPCNQYPCQNNGACHNVGNYNYRCACGSKWQGQTCQYRKVIREDLNKELQNSLSQNGGTSNDDYRDLLWNYLAQRYTYYYWYVGAYHPTGGWDNHAVTGQYMCFFRTHGRNLVVTWALRSSWKLPSNMDETMKKFERKLTGQGCDPRTINNMALRYGRNDLNYPTIMAHTVGWGNGLRSHYHTAFAFHLNYKCRGSSHISVIVAFGEQPWSPGPDRCKRGF